MGCAASAPRYFGCSELVLPADDTCVVCMETAEEGPHKEVANTTPKLVTVRQDCYGGPWLRLDCGHACHLQCVSARVDACRAGPNERLTFGHLTCATCRADIKISDPEQGFSARKLKSLLRKDFKLRNQVKVELLKHAQEDPVDKIEDLPEDEAEAEALIERKIGAFRCMQCCQIFCESIACADGTEANTRDDNKLCQPCRLQNNRKTHSLCKPVDFSKCSESLYKCDLCCSVAVFRCADYFQCEKHHSGPKNLELCLGGRRCPLQVAHPQNAFKRVGFMIGCGCGKCR
mmetsp:Transcript_14381/g.25287  ORF Transcript_14381/g.25287 Transcript_14381/m.25287 type:complete len:289 (-) Transcript_14381:342-1208(-)